MSSAPLVVFSERLGALGPTEQRIAEFGGARLEVRPLWTESDLIAGAADADVLVLGASEPMTGEVLSALPRLKAVVRRGVGVNNVDVPAATSLGIPVAYVPDASVEEVSDHALALALFMARGLPGAVDGVRDGDAVAAGRSVEGSARFADSVLGVVGLGRIGQALARKARGLFTEVIAYDPMTDASTFESLGVSRVKLDALWPAADVISLHVPSTPETRDLVNEATIRLMRRGAVLVNAARGDLVDEVALVAAVRSGALGGAALDVTRDEPLPADSPLRACAGIVLTGHTGAKGRRSASTLRQAVADAVTAVLTGTPPKHLANPEVTGCGNFRLRLVPAPNQEESNR
jgi:D-3-phosphoglycerate dehydrogenase